MTKPYQGKIEDWYKVECGVDYGLGYYIEGFFVDHPVFAGRYGYTSFVVKHDSETKQIETKNSVYLLGKEFKDEQSKETS